MGSFKRWLDKHNTLCFFALFPHVVIPVTTAVMIESSI